ncbi:MAG: hypothetical protein HY681_02215 [Chloroflexi bacterium]|nr:hypothetical protein [Chloroflexota bacterium]
MFDAAFYQAVLPDRVALECKGNPGMTPVVKLHLSNGQTLDVCHIVHLDGRWMAVQHFRDAQTCQDMDMAFLSYELVAMVSVSMQHTASRSMGFRLTQEAETVQGHGAKARL